MKRIIGLVVLSMVAGFVIIRCGGGGGGGGGGDSHAPVISNLQYSPTSAYINDGGGVVAVSGSLNFTDAGGDIKEIHVVGHDSSGNVISNISANITGASGVKSGVLPVSINKSTTIAGNFTYDIYIIDSTGTSSNVLIVPFTVSSDQPTVNTSLATSIGATSATVNGNVVPHGLVTTAWFEWGTSPTLATSSTTPAQSVGSGMTNVLVNAALSGLSTGTTYYVRVAASNSLGTSMGTIVSFTPGASPTVTTLAATSVAATSATFNGSVTPNGLTTTAWFEWGTSPTLATSSTTPAQSVGSGTTNVLVNAALSGLSTGTTYYVRVAASNSSGTSMGTIVTVTYATLSSISVTPANPSIPVGNTMQFAATSIYSDGTSRDITAQVIWSSSNTSVATVNSSGLATAVAAGTATVTATLGSITGSTTLTTAPKTMVSINVFNLICHYLAPGDIAPVSPLVQGCYDDGTCSNLTTDQVIWSSSNPAVATVDSGGRATAVSPGTYYITASAGGLTWTSGPLRVTPCCALPAMVVYVIPSGGDVVGMAVSDFISFEARCYGVDPRGTFLCTWRPGQCSNIIWSSSNAAIVFITPSGVATAIAPGTATIRATNSDGSYDQVTLVVTP